MLRLATKFALLGFVFADKAQIDRTLMSMVRNSSLRTFADKIAAAIPALDEYGCWCYFAENVGRGKGQPVNEIDSMCKILHDGYECAIRDSEDEGEDCEPWTVPYLSGTGSGRALYEHCKELNTDSGCSQRACAVETTFVENLFALLVVSGTGTDVETYSHRFGFDPSTDVGCPVKKGTKGSGPEKECCGQYPERFPYKTLGGERACCGSRTYQVAILNCCDGNKVKASC
jgi:hypothetical protein